MEHPEACSDQELYDAFAADRAERGAGDRERLRVIREFDKRERWEHDGCRNMGQWLAAEYGITVSQGLLWANAARVVENFTYIAKALEDGVLSLDKVVQICRIATPENQKELVTYARRRSLNAVRERADYECRKPREEARDAFEWRYLRWWTSDHTGSLGIDGRLPLAQGALVTKALEEIAERLKLEDEDDKQRAAQGVVAGDDEDDNEGDEYYSRDREQRYADALVELALGASGDLKSRKPLVVLHTNTDALLNDAGGSEIEGTGAAHPEIARRISCDARLQHVLHDDNGNTVGIGFTSRNIPEWLRREVMRRDRGCAFPGCGTRRYVDCHHVVPWPKGPTDLDNLILLCNFHHTLVHEGGWRVELDTAQLPAWYRPDGSRYERARPMRSGDDCDDDFDPGFPDQGALGPPRRRSSSLAVIAAGFS